MRERRYSRRAGFEMLADEAHNTLKPQTVVSTRHE